MQELRRSELEEIKRFFIEIRWIDGLFQFLFVLEDAKPGVFLQIEKEERRKLKKLRNMLYWFGLHVSMRHDGYATKDEELYKRWNKIFGFKFDAGNFLGYPACCVKSHYFGINVHFIHLYSIIKDIKFGRKSQNVLKQFFKNNRFLHHIPCKSDCVESINIERKFEAIIRKYYWLVGSLLTDFDKEKVMGIIQILKRLPTQISRDILNNRSLLIELEINTEDLMEILENESSFRENFEYGKRLLESLKL